MREKHIKPKKTAQGKPQLAVPVYRVATEAEYERFAENPERGDEGTMTSSKAIKKFYNSLHYPDTEVEIDLHS